MNKTVKGIVQVLFSSVRQIVNEREVRYVLVLYKYEYIHSEYHMNTGKGKCEHHHVRLAVQINWYPARGGQHFTLVHEPFPRQQTEKKHGTSTPKLQ